MLIYKTKWRAAPIVHRTSLLSSTLLMAAQVYYTSTATYNFLT